MKRAFSLLILLLSFLLTSATCSRKMDEQAKHDLPETLIPDGLGVNIHFLAAPQRDMDLIKAAHIRFIRADLTWAQVEREKGRYNFSQYDQLVDAGQTQGFRILFILDYGNRLYGQGRAITTDAQRTAFADYAAAAAARYKGKGVVWEIWNEPNIEQFWGMEPSVDDYMALVRITCKAIREADRNALIIAPGIIAFDTKFITSCAEKGLFDLVDGISYHPYREGGPESVLKSHHKLKGMIEEFTHHGKTKPRIISSEWGWGLSYLSEAIDGKVDPEMRQAAYLTRRFCVEAYAGVACAIHYKWREDNHGLIRSNYKPKPAYTAFKVLNEQLTRYSSSIARIEMGARDSVFIFLFEGPAGKKLAAWRVAGRETVAIPFKGREAKGVDFLGTPVRFNASNGMLELTISEKPVFIEMEE
jgi:hypothetical protein